MSELLINVNATETRVAHVEDGVLTELMLERDSSRSLVGDIYQGKVLRIMPGMEAAFVDIGLERAGFIHASDISAIDSDGIEVRTEAPARIGELLREGQFLIVQVIKDGIAGKGARLSNHLTLPGRNLVLLPRSRHIGVSQRIQDPQERARLQSLLESSLEASDWLDRRGFIVRTAATGAAADDLVEDLGHLHRLWLKLQERLARPSEVRCIYSEESLFVRVTRDLLSAKVTRIRIDNPEAYASLCGFLEDSIPEAAALTELVGCDVPLFESETDGENTIEQQILAALCKDVALPSGGDLVIEQTESMVTIDVNTGSFVGRSDQSETILATNLEAADAIARQLKLRNLGGIIVIDFIDMESAAHREQVRKALLQALASDSARTVVGEFSQFGLVEMTRKRSRESLPRLLQKPCETCAGEGRVLLEDGAS
ncbi:MAG: Rne/Rng family ribonuclease [Gammaproteobacteria bacterium]|nr:Rne/Rng family ribonuclease [Gammaproteobacteria bacterium]